MVVEFLHRRNVVVEPDEVALPFPTQSLQPLPGALECHPNDAFWHQSLDLLLLRKKDKPVKSGNNLFINKIRCGVIFLKKTRRT